MKCKEQLEALMKVDIKEELEEAQAKKLGQFKEDYKAQIINGDIVVPTDPGDA